VRFVKRARKCGYSDVLAVLTLVVDRNKPVPAASQAEQYPRARRQQPGAGAAQDRQDLLQRQRPDMGDHAALP
jgi:hypothetical protein